MALDPSVLEGWMRSDRNGEFSADPKHETPSDRLVQEQAWNPSSG